MSRLLLHVRARRKPTTLVNRDAKPTEQLDTGISKTFQSSRLMKLLSYNGLMHLAGFVLVYFAMSGSTVCGRISPSTELDWPSIFVLAVFVPNSIAILTALVPMKMTYKNRSSKRRWDNLYLCLVTKGTNPETVIRSVTSMRHLLALDPRLRLVIVTEQGRNFDGLGVDTLYVPQAYRPPKAKYKARSLEYFRITQRFTPRDWVLHLDEETIVDTHCVQKCIEFIEHAQHEWGQGIIAYNIVNYWTHDLLTYAEIVRFHDDITRFQFQHSRIHAPIWGCHGSFLLANGRVENAATWDTACLAEDFWFATEAWRHGFGNGFVPSVAREQIPWSIKDLMNQRRRWFRGLWTVGVFGKMNVIIWTLSTSEMPLTLALWAGYVSVPRSVEVVVRLYVGSSLWSMLLATILQDYDAGLPIVHILGHLFLTPFLSAVWNCLQIAVVVYSIFTPVNEFHVIVKK